MIKFSPKILPEGDQPFLAVSGGVDSMGALSFLTRGKNRLSGVVTINHQTSFGGVADEFVRDYCSEIGVRCDSHKISGSSELGWREGRREVFSQYPAVITAHHLDDVVEWWLLTAMRGCGRLIPPVTGNVYHPFLKTRKSDFEKWCSRYKIPFASDSTNIGDKNDRSKLRCIMPSLLNIYPGIHKSLLKNLEASR